MSKNSEELAARLADVFPAYKFTVMLSEEGENILGRLDDAWIESALRPLLLLHERIEVVLSCRDVEPMSNPAELQKPFEHVYEDGAEVGVITAQSRTDVPLERIMMAVPTAELVGKPANFKMELNTSKLAALVAKTYTKVYHAAPLTLDVYRQYRNTHGRGRKPQVLPAMTRAGEAGGDLNSKTMWIAMHWAESGGAEAWAWEQARIAKAAGFNLIFTFDRCAPQRQLNLASSMSRFVYLIDQAVPRRNWPALVTEIMATHRPGRIHIHHSIFAYSMIPLVKSLYPGVRIEDSTHISEHRGGGFVSASIGARAYVALHHVISPQLQRLYREGGVDSANVVYRPLTTFTSDQAQPRPVELPTNRPLRLGFLGRLSPQKRPVLFVALAAYLNKRYPGQFEFVMQGDGELEEIVSKQIRRMRLDAAIERRPWGPVADFFDDIDVLVITSENEGLTLTTIEADAAGVLVVSTDVGSQQTVIARGALLPREPIAFFKAARHLFPRLVSDAEFVRRLATEQRSRLDSLRSLESATTFFENHYAQIMRELDAQESREAK